MTDVTRIPTITISQHAPVAPLEGDLWWSTITGQQSIFYDDGDTLQWVISNWGGKDGLPGPPGPPGPASNGNIGFNPTASGVIVSDADYSHFPVAGLLPTGLLGVAYYHGKNHGQADLEAVALAQTLNVAGNFTIDGNEAVGGVASSVPGTKVSINDTVAADNSAITFTITGTEEGSGLPLTVAILGPTSAQTTVYTTEKFATVTSVTADNSTDGDVSVGFWIVPGSTAFRSSTDSGTTWSDEVQIFNGLLEGDALYYACVLAVTADGEFLVNAFRLDPDSGAVSLVSRRTTNQGTVWGDRFEPVINSSPVFWGTNFMYGQGKTLPNGDILFAGYTVTSGALAIYKTSDNGDSYDITKYRDEFELVAKLQIKVAPGNLVLDGYYVADDGVARVPPPVGGYLVSINQFVTTQHNAGVNFTIVGTAADAAGTIISVTIPGPAAGQQQSYTSTNNANAVSLPQTLGAAGSFLINGDFSSGGAAVSQAPTNVSINDVLASNNSGVHFTITGENPIGTAVSETIAGPGASLASVYTKKLFTKVNSVTTDAATVGNVSVGFKGYLFATVTSVHASAATSGEVSVGWNVPNAAEPALEFLDQDRWMTISRMQASQRLFQYMTEDGGVTWTGPLLIAAASGMTNYGYVSPTLTKYKIDGVDYLRLDMNVRESASSLFTPEPSQVAWYAVAETEFVDPTVWGSLVVVIDGSNGGPPNTPDKLRGRSGYQSVVVNSVTNASLMIYGEEYDIPDDPRKARVATIVSPPVALPIHTGAATTDTLAVGVNVPSPFGIQNKGVVQRTTTSPVKYNDTVKSTAPGNYTIGEIDAYRSSGGTVGAGSTISASFGFVADSNNINGTNNYGFFSGIEANPGTTASMTVSKVAVTAGIVTITVSAPPAVPMVTGQTVTVAVAPTDAGSFIPGVGYFISRVYDPVVGSASQTDFRTVGSYSNNVGEYFVATGVGSGTGQAVAAVNGSGIPITVTSATTFTYPRDIPNMPETVVGGTVNPGLRFAYYATGSAPSVFNGPFGLGTNPPAGTNFRVGRQTTGAVQSLSISNTPIVQPDVTTAFTNFSSGPTFASSGWTTPLSNYYHYRISGASVGGATVVNQHGYHVSTVLTTATNNYAFRSDLDANLGVSTTSNISTVAVASNVVTVVTTGNHLLVGGETVTVNSTVFPAVNGSGLTVTVVDPTTFTYPYTAPNMVATASAGTVTPSARWAFYAGGTANNALRGNTRFGGITAPLNTVDITGSFGRGAPVTTTAATLAVTATTNFLAVASVGGCVLTLPPSSPGRELTIVTTNAQAVTSATANVIGLTGGAANTPILPAVAGSRVTLVNVDGTNWRAF